MKKEKIGVYGGTFDPIHLGHLQLITALKEKAGLDQVWIVPAKQNPYKPDKNPVAAKHRLAMIELAVEDLPYCSVLSIELERESPSYTIDTLLTLTEKKLDNQELYLMMGDDAIPNFFRWKEAEEIVALTPLLIGSRFSVPAPFPKEVKPEIVQAIQKGTVKTPIIEISSTEIRRCFEEGLNCDHLIPTKVLDYILQNQLY